jgi:hypothetical protein
MAREGFMPVLKKSRGLLLKREENLKTEQRFGLRDLLRYDLKTVRAYLLKEDFQQLWDYNSSTGPAVPRPVVPLGDAFSHQANEENRPITVRASRSDPQVREGFSAKVPPRRRERNMTTRTRKATRSKAAPVAESSEKSNEMPF